MNLLHSMFLLWLVLVLLDAVPTIHLVHWVAKTFIEAFRIHILLIFLVGGFFDHVCFYLVIYWAVSIGKHQVAFASRIKSLQVSAFEKVPHEVIQVMGRNKKTLPMVYLSSKKENSPALIMIHGGAYKYGNSSQQMDTLRLFQRAGYNVFSLTYSLIPAHLNQAIEDVVDGFNYIEKHYKPSSYVIAGRSAGAHLAAILIQKIQPIITSRLKGYINFYGIMDIVEFKKSLDKKDLLGFKNIFRQLLQEKDGDVDYQKSISPTYFADQSFPRTLMFHGKKDSLVPFDQSEIFKMKLDELNIQNELVEFPYNEHVMEWNLYTPSGQIVVEKVNQFLLN